MVDSPSPLSASVIDFWTETETRVSSLSAYHSLTFPVFTPCQYSPLLYKYPHTRRLTDHKQIPQSAHLEMPVQRISRCKFRVGGSYTNNVVNLNVVTHSYNGRAHRTSSRTAILPSSSSISNLVLDAERLHRTARELSDDLKLTTSAEIEYNDLVTILDEIADETIPCILQVSLDYHQRDIRRQHRILVEVTSMQRTLDDFVRKRATDQDHATRSVRRIIAVDAIIDLLWSRVRWLFYPQYATTTICESLSASRDKIHLALFKPMASSIGKRIRCHQIDIDDFFGAQWSLPQDLCLNRQVFCSILRFKFQGGPAELVVASEQFGVFRQNGLRAIQAADWENVIKEGDGLQLSVFVSRQSENMANNSEVPECPHCGQNDKTVSGGSCDGWVTCLRCDSDFNVTYTDSELNAADQPSYSSTFRCFSITFNRVCFASQGVHSVAPNATNPSTSAPGVQQMPSGSPPGVAAWPPPCDRQKFDAAYKTYSARTGIKPEMRLMNMDGKPIDLHALHVNVMQEGGWTKVHNKELWSVIGGRMGFVNFPGSDTEPAKSGPGVTQRLASVYKEYLSGFDQIYINSFIDSRRKMQANQAGNGATMPNIPINNAMQGQPAAQGVPGAAGPFGGGGLKPPSNNPVQLTKLMQFASLPPDQLRSQGLPDHMIQFIEQNRADIQRAGQPGGSFSLS